MTAANIPVSQKTDQLTKKQMNQMKDLVKGKSNYKTYTGKRDNTKSVIVRPR